MKFFNIDCHISVVSDIKNIFEDLGHSVDHWSLSGHKWVFGFEQCESAVINEANWKNLDEEMVEKFYLENKKKLDHYDAFICAYPPCFLKLFEKFNKPIIVIAATRYDHPYTNDKKRLNWLEDSLKNNKNLILVANNQFDKKYCEHFLGNKWDWIPSLCNYTNSKYSPKHKEIIYFSKFSINLSKNFINKDSLGRYTWQDLYSYDSIMHFPYNVSTMSIFEQSEAGVPLHFPSLEFSLELLDQGVPLFSEIVFPNNIPERQAHNFLNENWLKYSDFYNGTIKSNHFDSTFNIQNKIKPLKNKPEIYNKWKKILSKF